MGILTLLIIGLIAGWLSGLIVKSGSTSLFVDMLLGVVGAFVGGFIMEKLGYHGLTGLNLYSILVATLGAVVVLAIWKLLRK